MITVVVVIITKPLLRSVLTPAAQAFEGLRNGNRSKLYPYISIRSNKDSNLGGRGGLGVGAMIAKQRQ